MMWHDPGPLGSQRADGGFLEPHEPWDNPATKRRLRNLVEVSGLLEQLVSVGARSATRAELERVHSASYVESIRSLNDRGGDAGEHATFGPGGYDAAALAVGGCIAAVDAVLGGTADNAYALVRPPGHHAERDRGRGFCIFANVAIAVRHAQAHWGLERIAVVDWDVHHGNGTQDAFYSDPSVLTISVHQDRSFPLDSGMVDERGTGPGAGYNVNVPLPPGSATAAYVDAFESVVLPALYAFRPELIIVACGLDANAMDPLARMMLHSESYRKLAGMVVRSASDLCEGRLVACHEGGYSTAYVPFCGLPVIEELSGVRTEVVDPFLEAHAARGQQHLQAHQHNAIEAARAVLDLEALSRNVRDDIGGVRQ